MTPRRYRFVASVAYWAAVIAMAIVGSLVLGYVALMALWIAAEYYSHN